MANTSEKQSLLEINRRFMGNIKKGRLQPPFFKIDLISTVYIIIIYL